MSLVKAWIIFITFLYCGFTSAQRSAFLEENGLVVIEIESIAALPIGWAEEVMFNDFTGLSYFRYAADNQYNNPGVDLLEYAVYIQNPGRYRFQWRSLIAEGTSTTDANDSWLKINGDAFYGLQGMNSFVCPVGYIPEFNDCPIELDDDGNTTPEGAGSDGWFKVYRTGSNPWTWSTSTSDFDGHNIYAQFDNPGIYIIQISGRSQNHAIDRMVLFDDDYVGDPLDLELTESPSIIIDLIYKNGFEF